MDITNDDNKPHPSSDSIRFQSFHSYVRTVGRPSQQESLWTAHSVSSVCGRTLGTGDFSRSVSAPFSFRSEAGRQNSEQNGISLVYFPPLQPHVRRVRVRIAWFGGGVGRQESAQFGAACWVRRSRCVERSKISIICCIWYVGCVCDEVRSRFVQRGGVGMEKNLIFGRGGSGRQANREAEPSLLAIYLP